MDETLIRQGKKGKDIVSVIGTIFTMTFKILIFATVLFFFSVLLSSWVVLLMIAIIGIGWVLGISNMVYLYMLFTGGKK